MLYVVEVLIVLLVAYGALHEDELVEFETVVKQYIRKKCFNGNFKKSGDLNNHD